MTTLVHWIVNRTMFLSGMIVINMNCSYRSLHKNLLSIATIVCLSAKPKTIGFVMRFDIGSVLSYHWLTCTKHVRASH